jgi:HK97 family phage major capsid protein
MSLTKELREKRAALHERAKQILDTARVQKRDLTAEEGARIDAIYSDVDRLKLTIDAMERSAGIEDELSRSLGRRSEPMLAGPVPGSDGDLALRAWLGGPKLAKPEWMEAADRIGLRWQARELETRALSVGTTTAGGNSVPNEIARSFTEVEKWYGRVQNVATVIPTESGSPLPWPTVDDTANTGELLTEATGATTTADPTFGVVNLAAYKMSSKAILVSVELLQDSSIPVANYIGSALGTRIGRVKNTYFTTGTGSSQPGGVQVKASLGKTASATNAITLDEVIDLYHSVDVAYRSSPNARFMMCDTVAAYLRKLKDSQGRYQWEPGVQVGQPDRLYGIAVEINNDQDSAFSTNKRLVLFGDFGKYLVRTAGNIVIARTDDLYFLSDQVAFKGYQRVDGQLSDTNAIKYLRTA